MTSIDELLERVFGFSELKPGQREVMDRLLAGRSALAVFPTGGGKSLCYQLPALALDGLTLVISPLIALMKDQVDVLVQRGVEAARLDSSLERDEVFAIYDRLAAGTLKLLYVAPERLASERFLRRLERARIALLAIDEAHCISEWGHNFRPDYLKLADLAESLGAERVLALTATATPAVAGDICTAFGIAHDDHVHTGFYRPNLTLEVTPRAASERMEHLIAVLKEPRAGASIVYVTLQRTAVQVAAALTEAGVRAEPYHAGLKDEQRHATQDDFMAGRLDTVVATIAFGMGIDKADIRRIIHYNLPKTLENYVQETGRAGRDGEPSVCRLLGSADDRTVLQNFSYGDTPDPERVMDLVTELLTAGPAFAVSQYDLSTRHDIRPLVISTALTYLELDGLIAGTGPFYAGYKLQFLTPEEDVVKGFDARRQTFLRSLFDAAKRGRKWLDLKPDDVAATLGEPRERILKALEYLDEQGHIELKVSGLQHGYRRLQEAAPSEVTGSLLERFQRREAADVARLGQVLDWASEPGCLTRRLLEYFGEDLGRPCGHCSACAGAEPSALPGAEPPPLGDAERGVASAVAAQGHEALTTPRQLTRFLCGLTSPAASRSRLGRNQHFGALSEHPFMDVLALCEELAGR